MQRLAPAPPGRDRPRKQDWLEQVFQCRAAETGGVIRRQAIDVEREVGETVFVAAVMRRGFRLIRTRHHFVVVCDRGPIEIIV